ncbi:MAG TPA: DUF2917 domain-containing protein [Albitalea sp.]|nr:DUF2917 domain-containing protein [Albitalea sp.]
MAKSRSPVLRQLQAGELLAVEAAWLSVVRGRVWITCRQDPDDHFLDAGHAMRLPRRARALVSAEEPALVSLVPAPSRLPAARRLVARLAAQCASLLTARRSWT